MSIEDQGSDISSISVTSGNSWGVWMVISTPSFFLTLTTIIISALGYCLINFSKHFYFAFILSIIGIAICFIWHDIFDKIRDRIIVKFHNILVIEFKMPMLLIFSEIHEHKTIPEDYFIDDDMLFSRVPVANSERYIIVVFAIVFNIIFLVLLIISIIKLYPALKSFVTQR